MAFMKPKKGYDASKVNYWGNPDKIASDSMNLPHTQTGENVGDLNGQEREMSGRAE